MGLFISFLFRCIPQNPAFYCWSFCWFSLLIESHMRDLSHLLGFLFGDGSTQTLNSTQAGRVVHLCLIAWLMWPSRPPNSLQAGRVVHPWLVVWPMA